MDHDKSKSSEWNLLREALLNLSEPDRLGSKEGFMAAVKFAENILGYKLASRPEPEIAATHYIRLHDLGDDISRHIQNLIDESKKRWTKQGRHDPERAFRTLVCLAIGIRRGHKPYPELLCDWMSNVIEETFAEDDPRLTKLAEESKEALKSYSASPDYQEDSLGVIALKALASYKDETIQKHIQKRRGRKIEANRIRDKAFREADFQLRKLGFTSTRAVEQEGERYDFCCFEGGSCADIIGVAYQGFTDRKSKYKTIAGIIRNPKHRSPDLNLPLLAKDSTS